MEVSRESGVVRSEVVQKRVYLGNCSSQTELGASSKEGMVEVDVATLEEGEESAYFLVVRNVFYEGDEGVPHSHVVGVGFANKANRILGVDGAV